MSMVELILHIGAGKCGSTAIQQFLLHNHRQLAEQGLLLPGRDLGLDPDGAEEHLLFFENGVDDEAFSVVVAERLEALRAHAIDNQMRGIIISAENLINPRPFWPLFVNLQDRFSLRIVAYVRRQDDFLISAWQQWQLKQYDNFWDYYATVEGRIDWHELLEPWRVNLEQANLDVRRYAPGALLDGDVVSDFCHAVGIDLAGTVRLPVANRSLDERYNTMANKHRDRLFRSVNDNRFYWYLIDQLGDDALKGYEGSTLLSLEERRRIVADHEQANQRLKLQYFAGLEGQLFAQPTAADVHRHREPPIDEVTERNLVEQFTGRDLESLGETALKTIEGP